MTDNDPAPEEQQVIDDPEAFHIASGGTVFFAWHHAEPVGVVAVR